MTKELFMCAAGILIGLLLIFKYTGEDKPTPTAIDVYRGNTTLEITYRDSVAIDSIVVFKDK